LEHPRERVQQVKVQVQEALALYPRLVVLGDPGSGKTTLLRYLALTYARDLAGDESEDADLVHHRLKLKEHRLPVLLPLRNFARYLEREHPDIGADGPRLLLDYLRIYFENQDLPLPPRFFADRLQEGDCVVLLDGVDEVANVAMRQRVARLIELFTHAYPANRMVVTSRVVGYTGAARLGADFAVTTVRDFTQADIARFVAHWNRAVEVTLAKLGNAEPPYTYALQQAEKQTRALLDAIQNNERVRELAVNPLLLTVIALVQRYRAQLPERRTELYEEAVEVLLGKWDEAKGLASTVPVRGVPLDAGDRRSLLEPVALWMMEAHAREIEGDDLRRQLGEPFAAMVQDAREARKAVDDFLRLINARSGLLTERGQGIYAFSHLTFQEHLAARAVADREDYVAYTLACIRDSWWREVILLEAGYLSTQGKRRVTELVRAIMDCEEEPAPYHNLMLAAEAMRDVGPARTVGDLGGEIQRRLRGVFEVPLRKGADDLPALIRQRAAAAEALARIESGTPGTQPAFWEAETGEPVWVEVPAGAFWMGSEQGQDREKPVHKVDLARYWIARVPITNAQYHLFVEATGHRAPSHWDDGRVPRGLESHPVVNVSWRDAMAYCAWLTEELRKAENANRLRSAAALAVRVGTHVVTLPSEAQWEKAARGPVLSAAEGSKREYPWGESWDATLCNNRELELGSTTPVGIFPDGASPYGCLDMAGNMWEWTRSVFQSYPYDAEDGREDMEVGGSRVVRGGSFLSGRHYARGAYRSRGGGDVVNDYLGFRVCVSPSRSAL
jgi:formylglycine-generating enzyme required for sulfatase activity